jgi:hypothetical protein
MLSDPALARAEALWLLIFVADGETFSQRLTIIANRPTIEMVPVDNPQNMRPTSSPGWEPHPKRDRH